MLAIAHKTYRDYCNYNTSLGYQVIPETLWDALKAEFECQ